MENLIVQKYGGTSVGSVERIKKVAKRIVERADEGKKMVVVVSAMGKQTDHLVEMAKSINPNPPSRELDVLMATGEQESIALLAMAIQALGHSVISLTGAQCGIKTSEVHKKARIEGIDTSRLQREIATHQVVIVAGFQGVDDREEVTTLGRGGSDTSAVALAAALKAESCEIYTDVDGVYDADPRIVPDAKKSTKFHIRKYWKWRASEQACCTPALLNWLKNINYPWLSDHLLMTIRAH